MIRDGERGSASGRAARPEAAAELARRDRGVGPAHHRPRSGPARTRSSGCCSRARPSRAARRRSPRPRRPGRRRTGRRCPSGSTRSSRTPGPRIYTCFNQADLLISDVSSVVSRLPGEREAVRGGEHQRAARGGRSARASRPCARRTILTPEAAGCPGAAGGASAHPEKDTLAGGPRRAEGAPARPLRPAVAGPLQRRRSRRCAPRPTSGACGWRPASPRRSPRQREARTRPRRTREDPKRPARTTRSPRSAAARRPRWPGDGPRRPGSRRVGGLSRMPAPLR